MSDWSNLVGKTGEEAKAQILQQEPGLNVIVMPQGAPCTRDYRLDRVRVFVDNDQKVVSAPRKG